jgi:calcium-dependent protein kinase
MLRYEFSILESLNHPNMIKGYTMVEYFDNLLIITMDLAKVNLKDYVDKRRDGNKPLNEDECALVMTGLLRGIQYLHDEHNLIHRDLKPGNIMLDSDHDLSDIKIIDFGTTTKDNDESKKKFGNIGTLIYQPPE